ncbi:hypothetical protein M0804_005017 [Polistes exclamans]|nr:hypothetical protein M0804_005017 [Polistes exclamans]
MKINQNKGSKSNNGPVKYTASKDAPVKVNPFRCTIRQVLDRLLDPTRKPIRRSESVSSSSSNSSKSSSRSWNGSNHSHRGILQWGRK